MTTLLKAIRYRNLDEARTVIRETLSIAPKTDIFDDGGEEPQGLLSVVPEDLLSEEDFHRLFGVKRGTLIEVERVEYSGFGPLADDENYMGFVTKERAYVVKGCHYPVEIESCPHSARDIHHLGALVMDDIHPLNANDLAERLEIPVGWSFDDLYDLIVEGQITGEEIDRLIHMGIQ